MTNQITPTEGQVAQVKDLLGAAIRKSGVSKDGMDLLIGNGGVFQDRILPIIQDLGGITPNPYEKEVTNRTCGYPTGWTVPTFDEQLERTAKMYPDLVLPEITNRDIVVPGGWDGIWWFPPKIAAIGRICAVADPYVADYGTVVKHLLALIGQQRDFTNYRTQDSDQLTADYIRINELVRGRIQTLESATEGDFLPPMPITFGQFYGGFSPRNARETSIRRQELPFCTAYVASLLGIMPERLVAYEDIWIDVPGDEYNWDAGGSWTNSLCFGFGDGRLKLYARDAGSACGRCGSVVGSPGVLELVA